MRWLKCIIASVAVASIASLIPIARGDTIKVLHITNPTDQPAFDTDVGFALSVKNTPPPTLNPQGVKNPNQPSDHFDSGSGSGTQEYVFTGGTLPGGATDDFRVWLNGNVLPYAKNIVTQVGFSDKNGKTFKTIKVGTKEFQMNVAGFTNAEYYDLSNSSNGLLHLVDENPSFHIQYTLTNLKVYTNLSLGNFNLDHYLDNLGTPVYSNPDLVLSPGQDLGIPLGPIQSTGYEVATVDTITITDLDTGTSNVYSTPQSYAQSQSVPEPSGVVLLVSGLVLLLCVSRKGGVSGTSAVRVS